jgi:hypothetical protein
MEPKIRPLLALWGARMGFMSYGWDAGVLGGVLETVPFQSAMQVSITSSCVMTEDGTGKANNCVLNSIQTQRRFP